MEKKNRRLKNPSEFQGEYGGYATVVTIVVVILLMTSNLLVDQSAASTSPKQDVFLSQQTYDILDALDQDVRIIGLYAPGTGIKSIDRILQKYADRSLTSQWLCGPCEKPRIRH